MRACTMRNAIKAHTPMASAIRTSGLPKPTLFASVNPYTMPPKPSVARIAPHQSRPRRASSSLSLSGTRQNSMNKTTAAIGMLIKKTQRQEAYCTSQPPSTGPRAEVMAVKPDQVPMARPRCSLSKKAPMIARLPGTSSAPNPLDSARNDQKGYVWRKSARQRGQCKDRDARSINAPTPVVVSQAAAHQDERGQKERVCLHDPLHIGNCRFQFRLKYR